MYGVYTLIDTSRTGGLLTLFLYSPLIALCYVCGIADIRFSLWEQCQKHVKKTLLHVRNLILHSKEIGLSFFSVCNNHCPELYALVDRPFVHQVYG